MHAYAGYYTDMAAIEAATAGGPGIEGVGGALRAPARNNDP